MELRNHYSKFLVDTAKIVWTFILIAVFNIAGSKGLSDAANEVGATGGIIIGLGALLIAALILLINFLRWRKTKIIIDEDELIINRDFKINKNVTTIRLSSIATVNLQQGIPDHIFNTYRLQLDINSSVTAEDTDFNLVFDKETAEKVKAILVGDVRLKGQYENGETIEVLPQTETAPETERQTELVYKFTDWQVIRHCLLSISVSAILILLGTIIPVVLSFRDVSSAALGFVSLLVIIVPLLWTQIAPLVNYYGFKIERDTEHAIVSYGFFTHRQYHLPLDKTNAVILYQPLIARLFGYYYGDIVTVGMGDQENKGTPIFCLLLKKEEIFEIVRRLNPDMEIHGFGESSPKSAFIPVVLKYLVFTLPPVVASFFFIPAKFYFAPVLILAFMIFAAFLSYRTKALAVLDDKLVISSGVFKRRIAIIPNRKVQILQKVSGPVSRKLGLAHGTAIVLGSLFYRKTNIGYFESDRYNQLFEKIV